MADPKKLRADANALAVELLQRLKVEELQELEVRRGSLRVRVSKSAPAAVAAPTAVAQPATTVATPAASAAAAPRRTSPTT